MLSLEEAQSRILAQVKFLPGESLTPFSSDRRFLLEPAFAQVDLPGFDNSAMDGYAVRVEDLEKACAENPIRLRVIGMIAAGQEVPPVILTPGTCMRVFTGSSLPQGADAVVMQEDIRPAANGWIECLEPARPLENIRLRGEDVKKGALLLSPGERLNSAKLSVCAAAGIASLNCVRQPIVGLIATGNELVEPGTPLQNGQIYESNRVALATLTRAAGGVAKLFPIVPDSLEATGAVLTAAFEQCDFVVTAGGVSVGEFDFVKQAFESLGGTLDFWRVAIKPGKPFVFGKLGVKPLFGLPGNPVSAFVTFLLLVRPALLRAQGAWQTGLRSIPSFAGERFTNRGDRRHFLRVQFTDKHEVKSAGVQASHMLSSLAQAEGLLDLRPGSTVESGSPLSVLVWE